MAPLPNVPNVVKVTLQWVLSGGIKPETILHFAYTGGPPAAADCIAIASTINSAGISHLEPLLHNSAGMSSITVLDLASSTGAEGVNSTGFTGTRTGTENFANVCCNIENQIARRYRGGKPKSFPPFGAQADLASPKAWTSGLVSAVNSGWQAFITAAAAASSGTTNLTHQVSVSYYQGYGTPVTQPSGRVKQPLKLRSSPVVDQVLVQSCSTIPGSQRKRLRKN